MMIAGNFDTHPNQQVVREFLQNLFECLSSNLGMMLHRGKLFRGQAARLEVNMVRNANFADVMQGCGFEETADESLIDAILKLGCFGQFPGQAGTEKLGSLEVPPDLVIASISQADQGKYGRQLHVGHFFGFGLDQVLQIVLAPLQFLL